MTNVETFKAAALQVLRGESPLRFKEIANRAMDLRLIDMDETTMHSYMDATLASAIDEHGKDSAFASPTRGHYVLNSGHAGPKKVTAGKISPISRSFRRAALGVLTRRQAAMHYRDIAEAAMKDGLIELTEDRIHRCMGAILHDDIRKHRQKSAFTNPNPAAYGLNPQYGRAPGIPPRRPGLTATPKPRNARKVSAECIGRGGEYLVASRLSFLGYDVHEPCIDLGIDLVAVRGGKAGHYFQVKTSTMSGKHQFHITKSAFENTASRRPFYVFVLRYARGGETHEDFLLISYEVIHKHISDTGPRVVQGRYVIKITQKEDSLSLDGSNEDLTRYMNNWEIIE